MATMSIENTVETFQGRVEKLVDGCTLFGVVEALQTICYEKADHLRSNWQDEASAKAWNRAGAVFNRVLDNPKIRSL